MTWDTTKWYCTEQDVKSARDLGTWTGEDDQIPDAIEAASRLIEEKTGRRFYPDTDANQVRRFVPQNGGYCVIDDLCEFTSLVAQDSTWTQDTDFYLEPTNAPADGEPWTAIRTIARPFLFTLADRPAGWYIFDGRVAVTGKWGWAATPGAVHEACILLAARLVTRVRMAPLAVYGGGIDNPAIRLGRWDPDIEALLAPFTLTVVT